MTRQPQPFPVLQASCALDVPMNSTDASAYMAQQCSPGYYGPLCSLCITQGSQRYGRTGVLTCQPCRSHAAILLAYIGSGILVLLFLTYTIHVTLRENEEAAHGLNDPQTVQASELLRVSASDQWPVQAQAWGLCPTLGLCSPCSLVLGFDFSEMSHLIVWLGSALNHMAAV